MSFGFSENEVKSATTDDNEYKAYPDGTILDIVINKAAIKNDERFADSLAVSGKVLDSEYENRLVFINIQLDSDQQVLYKRNVINFCKLVSQAGLKIPVGVFDNNTNLTDLMDKSTPQKLIGKKIRVQASVREYEGKVYNDFNILLTTGDIKIDDDNSMTCVDAFNTKYGISFVMMYENGYPLIYSANIYDSDQGKGSAEKLEKARKKLAKAVFALNAVDSKGIPIESYSDDELQETFVGLEANGKVKFANISGKDIQWLVLSSKGNSANVAKSSDTPKQDSPEIQRESYEDALPF